MAEDLQQKLKSLDEIAKQIQPLIDKTKAGTETPAPDLGSLFGSISTATLVMGVVGGVVGTVYIARGRRTMNIPMIVCGVLLCFVPYAITDDVVLALVSVCILAAPFVLEQIAWYE